MNLNSRKWTAKTINNHFNLIELKKPFLSKTPLFKVLSYLLLFILFLSFFFFKPLILDNNFEIRAEIEPEVSAEINAEIDTEIEPEIDTEIDSEINAYSSTRMQDFIDITAESAIVMDYDTKRILWEKNSDRLMYPASTTKMLSAIVAIENIPDINETVIISKNASGRNNSFFAFKTGDEITLLDLLKAALIFSHNNATIALAEYISGSEQEFVELMNKKANKLGAYNTFFLNTNGLDIDYPEHKTTAKDLAIIAHYCLKNDLFKQIVSTIEDTITINDEKIEIKNTNNLLSYNYIKGIKTGFTENAGGCLVTYSEHNGLNLISIVLNSEKGSREADILKLIKWANENFSNEKIVDSGNVYRTIKIENIEDNESIFLSSKLNLVLYPEEDFIKLVKKSDVIVIKDNIESVMPVSLINNNYNDNDNFDANTNYYKFTLPVKNNEKIANLFVYINNEEEKEINLIAADSIEKPETYIKLSDKITSNQIKMIIFFLGFYFLIIIFIIVKTLVPNK